MELGTYILIAETSLSSMQVSVNRYIKQGYTPQGGIIVSQGKKNVIFTQAMLRAVPEEKMSPSPYGIEKALKVSFEQEGNGIIRADPTALPGMPMVGRGATKAEAMYDLCVITLRQAARGDHYALDMIKDYYREGGE